MSLRSRRADSCLSSESGPPKAALTNALGSRLHCVLRVGLEAMPVGTPVGVPVPLFQARISSVYNLPSERVPTDEERRLHTWMAVKITLTPASDSVALDIYNFLQRFEDNSKVNLSKNSPINNQPLYSAIRIIVPNGSDLDAASAYRLLRESRLADKVDFKWNGIATHTYE